MANLTTVVSSIVDYCAKSVLCAIPADLKTKLVKKKATLRLKAQGHNFIRDIKLNHVQTFG